jgi:hypothetical protein
MAGLWSISVRYEQTLRDYFDYYLHRYQARSNHLSMPTETPRVSKEGARFPASPPAPSRPHFSFRYLLKDHNGPKMSADGPAVSLAGEKLRRTEEETPIDDRGTANGATLDSEVEEVILVRKLAPLASLRSRRQGVLRQLELVSLTILLSLLPAQTDSGACQLGSARLERSCETQPKFSLRRQQWRHRPPIT